MDANPFAAPAALTSMGIGLAAVVIVVVVLGLMIAMQVVIARRARAMEGKPVPPLPGAIGHRISARPEALVYFFSAQCGACRAITPRVKELSRNNASVFAVDVVSDMDLARALGVMATPSTVELRDGKIAGYHVGSIPAAVMGRFM